MSAFEEKVVVITGAGSGIGQIIALTYAEKKAKVVIVDKDEKGLETTAGLIREVGQESVHQVVDISQPREVERLFQSLRESLGRVDILVNNAGFGIFKSMFELSLEEWDSVIHTNLRGTFLCSREAAKLMKLYGGGSIVNISSTRALMSEPNSESYAASKGGILSLTHALAVSLGPDHITVNAISPGWIETGDYSELQPKDHKQHPSMRVGRPEDVARACLYLTHPDNNFVTGTNLVLDGGMTKKMIYE